MCNEYEILISRAIDHDLTDKEQQQLVAHLKKCKACQRDFEALKKLKEMSSQVEPVALPEGFHTQLMAKVQMEPKTLEKRKVQPSRWYKGGAVAASLFVMVAVLSQVAHLGLDKGNANAMMESVDRVAIAANDAGDKAVSKPEIAENSTKNIQEKNKESAKLTASGAVATASREASDGNSPKETLEEQQTLGETKKVSPSHQAAIKSVPSALGEVQDKAPAVAKDSVAIAKGSEPVKGEKAADEAGSFKVTDKGKAGQVAKEDSRQRDEQSMADLARSVAESSEQDNEAALTNGITAAPSNLTETGSTVWQLQVSETTALTRDLETYFKTNAIAYNKDADGNYEVDGKAATKLKQWLSAKQVNIKTTLESDKADFTLKLCLKVS